ncbi:MAG: fibronectin type III domain-containing protein, partial [Coriobacteriia bacterium]|nr:fibronectin type III domain-containing protein [Coriobacteriia bacterium]
PLVKTTQTYDPLHDPDYVDTALRTAVSTPDALSPQATDLQQEVAQKIKDAASTYRKVTLTLGGLSYSFYGVSIAEYGLSSEEVSPILQMVWDDPEMFYFPFSVTKYGTSKCVMYVTWDFTFGTLDEITAARASLDRKVDEALTWANVCMTPLQKAQAMHDYLVRTCAYDHDAPPISHTSYGALILGKPVCQGYAMAYKLLLGRLGVPCAYVTSDAMCHGWSMVQLDGVWYHVDVTWDDPTIVDADGNKSDKGFDAAISYRYYLKSDATFQDLSHYDWSTDGALTCPKDYPTYSRPVYNAPSVQGHVWGESPVVDRQPTYDYEGSQHYECTRCDARTASEPIAKLERPPVVDPDPGIDPDPSPDPNPDPQPDPDPGSQPGVDPDPNPDPEPQPGVGPGPDPNPGPGVDPDPQPDPSSDPDPQPNVDPVPDATPLDYCDVRLSTSTYTYNGKARTPRVAVRLNGDLLPESAYTVRYAAGRKLVGTYAVTVTAASGQSITGSTTLRFTIKPRATSVTSLRASKRAFTARWSKRVSQTSGYQIQYRAKGSSATKTVTVRGTSTTAKKITKLRAKTRYYVKVRTYKTVGGKRYYSAWSSAKAVTTR